MEDDEWVSLTEDDVANARLAALAGSFDFDTQFSNAPVLTEENAPLAGGYVLQVDLISCKELEAPPRSAVLGTNPYVSFRVQAPEMDVPEQVYHSSALSHTIDPIWSPPERFQFVIANLSTAKLIICVMDHKIALPDHIMGFAMIKIGKLCEDTNRLIPTEMSLVNESGQHARAKIKLDLHLLPREVALSTRQLRVWEYEIYHWGQWSKPPTIYGSPGSQGFWRCQDSRDEWGMTSADVQPPVPQGWVVVATWHIYSDWSYSTTFTNHSWSRVSNALTYVRRRGWILIIQRASSAS